MPFRAGLLVVVCATAVFAQAKADPEIARAQAEISKTETLVRAGALPRNDLLKAETDLADARDEALLRKTLYGSELTGEQAYEMLAAATRRVERRQLEYEKIKKLVEAGVLARIALNKPSEELNSVRKELELAESRSDLVRDLAAMARTEEALHRNLEHAPAAAGKTLHYKLENGPVEESATAEHYEGNGIFTTTEFSHIETAFESRFGKPLPVSANGETAVHRALGFDHRGRVDVAIYPDTPEGIWLREYLTQNRIPYFAFWHAVPGKATGAHIHIGPASTRLRIGG